jgi:hypothetical protein
MIIILNAFIEICNSTYIPIFQGTLEFLLTDIINFLFLKNNNILNLTEPQCYYMKDFNYFQNIKKNENFQIIINNYILKDYFIFNNINTVTSMKLSLLNEQQ